MQEYKTMYSFILFLFYLWKYFIGYYHGSSIVHGGDYLDDFGYYKAHHGFSIVNGGFSYKGAGEFFGVSNSII